jgi:hypothetical protein
MVLGIDGPATERGPWKGSDHLDEGNNWLGELTFRKFMPPDIIVRYRPEKAALAAIQPAVSRVFSA